jgi:hypothetical protein
VNQAVDEALDHGGSDQATAVRSALDLANG